MNPSDLQKCEKNPFMKGQDFLMQKTEFGFPDLNNMVFHHLSWRKGLPLLHQIWLHNVNTLENTDFLKKLWNLDYLLFFWLQRKVKKGRWDIFIKTNKAVAGKGHKAYIILSWPLVFC